MKIRKIFKRKIKKKIKIKVGNSKIIIKIKNQKKMK